MIYAAISIVATMPAYTLDEIIDAIGEVESGNRDNVKDGDNGRSIGRYQIQRAYWRDSKIPGRHSDCRRADYARSVMVAYWRRYQPRAFVERDAECLARVHNGGPGWRLNRKATNEYWRRVQRALKSKAK